MNTEFAKNIIINLSSSGVVEFCICPGARNAPLIAILAANAKQFPDRFKVFYFFEERCASFFALGRIKSTGKPVAVVTTSGTATAELLPATMEAYYTGLPLVLLTADRPRHYRGSGAPQSADQVGLYGIYSAPSVDLTVESEVPTHAFSDGLDKKPVHWNVCFDEPLLEPAGDGEIPYLFKDIPVTEIPVTNIPVADHLKSRSAVSGLGVQPLPMSAVSVVEVRMKAFLAQSKFPIAILGSLEKDVRESVVDLLLSWNIPTYCEGLSGLREDPRLEGIRFYNHDKLMEKAALCDYPIDGVLRIGGVPLLRFWRDLESKYSGLPVLNLSAMDFSGLGRPSEILHGNLDSICRVVRTQVQHPVNGSQWARLLEEDQKWKQKLVALLREEPRSEPGMFAALSEHIPNGSRVYLGNSLPVREWDLAAAFQDRGFKVWGSRGVNGIDGQVSTFLGYAKPESKNWGILGDLTALYDLPGPWILSQLKDTEVNLVVVNNGGGKIFSRMFPLPEFQNQHTIRFKAWAELWGLSYESWTEVPLDVSKTDRRIIDRRIIEITPCEESTQRFWKKYHEI